MIPLEAIITPEQLLKYAVNNYNISPECEISENIISWYIFNQHGDINEEEFDKYFHKYVSEYTLESMCEKGILEYNFETRDYQLTKSGEKLKDEYQKHIRKNTK